MPPLFLLYNDYKYKKPFAAMPQTVLYICFNKIRYFSNRA